MVVFEALTANLNGVIETFGPLGIFLAMFVETVFPPIPSEIVMPLGGYIAYVGGQGYLGLFTMILAGSLGSTLGAIMIYFIALKGGRSLVLKYGRKVGVNEKKIAIAEKWFKKYGDFAVFFGRMAPGIRELISIPAGFAKMDFVRFLSFTFAGSLGWSAFLGSIGYFFADTWRDFNFDSMFGIVGLVVLLSIAAYFVFKYFVNYRKKKLNENK